MVYRINLSLNIYIMNIMRNILRFYRMKDWIKSLGFSILGLSIFIIDPFLLFLGLIQACFLFSFLFSLNDFFDYLIYKEKNFIGNLINKSVLSKKLILLLCFLPLILSTISLIINFSISYFVFYILFIILSVEYSLPKVRLRDIPIIDVICNVLFFSLIFLQSYFFVSTKIITKLYFFLFWIIFYIFSHEIIHQISHFEKDKKSGRISTVILLGKERSIYILKFSFLLPVVFGILVYTLFVDLKLFASIMVLSNLLRFFYIRNFNKKLDFEKSRNNLGGVFEGFAYFILNIIT